MHGFVVALFLIAKIDNNQPSVLAHTCNPSYLEGADWEDPISSQSGQKVHETPSQQIKSWAWWYIPVIQLGRKYK
jgi:hypothetical protein